MPTNKPKPKKELGPPLSLTDEELDSMSQITPADIKAAVALWDENAGPLKGLLQATPEEDDNNNSPTE
jgi:hypothetical protein